MILILRICSSCIHRIVKLNSPNLNYIIIVGVTVMIVGLTFYYLPVQSKPALRFICTVSNYIADPITL